MSIPEIPKIIGPISPKGNTLEGIVYQVKKYIEKPAKSQVIIPRGSNWDNNYPVSNTIDWDGDWASGKNDPILEIDFGKRKICPTHYSIRGTSISWCFSKEWNLYGYNNNTKTSSRTLLSSDHGDENSFCGDTSDCSGRGISTFALNRKRSGCFRFLRFETTVSSCPTYHFTTSGLDFYGVLILGNLKTNYIKQERINSILLLLLLITK